MRLSPRYTKKTLEKPSPRVRGVHIYIGSKKRQKTKKGDIFIEVRKGTFLKSFDNLRSSSLTYLTPQPKMSAKWWTPHR
jgi:hypothetical protein